MNNEAPFFRFVGFLSQIAKAVGGGISRTVGHAISPRIQIFLLSSAIAGIVFLGDVMLPMGVASGVPYIGAVLVALWSNQRKDTIFAAATCSILILVGLKVSPLDSQQWPALVHWTKHPVDAIPNSAEFWNMIANRFLALFVVWVTAVTGLRRKQEAERIRLVFESAPNGMVMVNPQGRIVLANSEAEAMFGYPREELIGQPVEILLPFRFRDRHPRLVALFFAAPDARPMGKGRRIYGLPKGGGEFPIEIGLTPVQMHEGTLVLATIVDVTDQMRAERERERAEEARRAAVRQLQAFNETLEERVTERTREVKERAAELARANTELERSNLELQHFAYIASHDLQEPLRMVGTYCQLLKRRYAGKLDKDADEFIDFAVDGAKRSQQMVEDLLTYSRVDTQAKPFAPTNCEVLVELAMRNLAASIRGTRAKITHDPLPVVMADSSQLAQVFQNLIGNAVKFHGEAPPRVHISAKRQGKDWLFSVSDNGIGMDSKFGDQIFVIFKRLQGREKYPGTGIGLAICKRVVERQRGRIWVESSPGVGSTFYFTLPARASSESEKANKLQDGKDDNGDASRRPGNAEPLAADVAQTESPIPTSDEVVESADYSATSGRHATEKSV
ncbi:MAG: PAS domain S-box protein [Planctomycetales bacterium]|nr:PAS domain S-box protein [Planctomycetales bacterium]